ncbi:MAG: 3-isopropylmalate dehydratase [Pseudomonas sp.]|uniref:3-isopropylmalate dehydratase n=1 Tax=Pseudomonas abieticivorans TaxID=2931382 RepID=UPI0020BF0D62|nr:3-isopropylmalate dehydratase [Pseudomonas sp. PIA16]MDE1164789.1 3-isopropylmalate dehydratase [Pseudomonas sp.]
MRLICAALAVLAVSGCSSYRAAADKVAPVPADRLLGYQAPLDNAGQIVVNRDLGMLGGGCYVAVLIDRQVVARIGTGEVVRFTVPTGRRVVGIGVDSQDTTLCSQGRLNQFMTVQLDPGQTQSFRIVSESKNGFILEQDPR